MDTPVSSDSSVFDLDPGPYLPWEYGYAPDDGDVGAHEWTNVTPANDRFDGGEAAW